MFIGKRKLISGAPDPLAEATRGRGKQTGQKENLLVLDDGVIEEQKSGAVLILQSMKKIRCRSVFNEKISFLSKKSVVKRNVFAYQKFAFSFHNEILFKISGALKSSKLNQRSKNHKLPCILLQRHIIIGRGGYFLIML